MSAVASQYRPGTQVVIVDQPGPVSAPTATDAWFVVGTTVYGPTNDYSLVRSMDDFETYYGPRDPASVLWDCVETYLREGGSRCYVSAVAPTGGAAASVGLKDGSAAASLTVAASRVGLWGNQLRVGVTAVSGGYQLQVTYGTTVETSPVLVTAADAAAWSASTSNLVKVTAAGANPPASAAPAPLIGGTAGTYDDPGWSAALDVFVPSLGPGQVSAPGRTTTAGQSPVLAHALANNRVALLDMADTANVATLTAAATALRTGGDQDHQGGLFAGWAVIPGLAAGTTRQVPWSPIQAGLYARNEGAGVSVAQPAAGQTYGRSRVALGLTQPTFKPVDRNTLTLAGINTARGDLGIIESYGSRTLVDAAHSPQWRELSQTRLLMAITAKAGAIAEAHLFSIIDGRRHETSKFGGELKGMLMPYVEDGSLYGDTPDQAFRVDVGEAVNSDASIAAGELRAVIGVRPSHMAEFVYIEIVRSDITQAL